MNSLCVYLGGFKMANVLIMVFPVFIVLCRFLQPWGTFTGECAVFRNIFHNNVFKKKLRFAVQEVNAHDLFPESLYYDFIRI